ncbi:MAG: hypothetical protein L0G23_06610 [Ruaniaceae bacterium]|nr:hypothetical protein [Ruaniaceae bacterium]
MMQYLRLTVIGSRRKADVAVPDDEPVEQLLAEIIALLGEPPDVTSPLTLTTMVGVHVEPGRTFSEQGIDSGAVLRLHPLDSAPQPPDVAEVTEAVASATVNRTDRWNSRLTAIALGLLGALLAGTTAAIFPFADGTVTPTLGVLLLLGSVGGALLMRKGHTSGFAAVLGLTLGVVPELAWDLAGAWLPDSRAVVSAALAWALLWIVLATVCGVGARRRSVIFGAAFAVVASAIVIVAVGVSAPVAEVAAVAGIIIAVLIGLVPALALTGSGVAGFDYAVIDGGTVLSRDVSAAIDEAFRTQTALVCALSVPLSVSIVLLGLGDGWGQALAAVLTLFTLVRARLFPLAVARATLLVAAVLPILLWLVAPGAAPVGWRAAVGAVACAAILLVSLLRFSAATQARLRRLLGTIEGLAVIAMVPLLLGILGVFGDLLEVFR